MKKLEIRIDESLLEVDHLEHDGCEFPRIVGEAVIEGIQREVNRVDIEDGGPCDEDSD